MQSLIIFSSLLFLWGSIIITLVYIILSKRVISKNQWVTIAVGFILALLLVATFNTGKEVFLNTGPKQLSKMVVVRDTIALGSIDKTQLLLESIRQVESKQDSLAKNKSGASGDLQIMPIAVKEANQILGKKRFNSQSRFSKDESEQMFHAIQSKYNPQLDIEKAIRIWNGGPKYNKIATDVYFRQVKAIYDKKCDGKIAEIVKNVKSLKL